MVNDVVTCDSGCRLPFGPAMLGPGGVLFLLLFFRATPPHGWIEDTDAVIICC